MDKKKPNSVSATAKHTIRNVVELDNNATTRLCQNARKAFCDYIDCFNPSSHSKFAKPAQKVIERTTDNILAHCGVSTATHTIIYTSGATESNCTIIRMCVKSYKKRLKSKNITAKPHVIVSSLEHHSILACVEDLLDSKEIDVSYVQPSVYGVITKDSVEAEIKPTTCLVSIMYAGNEMPAINNIKEIGRMLRTKRIPLHSDCVQIFGKFRFNIAEHNIDALSASAHKFYGPKGVGLLIINNELIGGYKFTAEINGTQQHALRGGTENVAGIASVGAALEFAFRNRHEKNQKLYELRTYCLAQLSEKMKMVNSLYYLCDRNDLILQKIPDHKKEPLEIISLGPPNDKTRYVLPNTLLLAVCKNIGKPFCNGVLKDYLDSKNIIVSVGSACNTSSDKASHVLTAINAPPVVKRGVIRVSFSDYTTKSDIDTFIAEYCNGIKKQCADLDRLLE
jgi:cysteine desulfurase